jgi:phage gp46-like protein
MPDIRLVQNSEFPNHPHYSVTIDWNLLDSGALDETQALATAVVVALGTDSLAAIDDLLPDPDSTDRAGWWGDLDPDIWDSWPIGCKLWLLKRSKIEGPGSMYGSTVVRVEQYIRDAIQPFVDRAIASQFDVKAVRVSDERIDALIKIYRGPEREISLRFQILWEGIRRVDPEGPYYSGDPYFNSAGGI